MNVAIVHYHLNRGGVTQVIANHLRSLDAAGDATTPESIAIFYGGRHEGWPDDLLSQLDALDVSLCVVEGLEYDEDRVARPRLLAEALHAAFKRIGFVPQETVVHVHNHALGKNVSLPGALAELARREYHLLLQIHDFPEDFRPANYRRLSTALASGGAADLPSILYPQAEHIHYSTLNGRDDAILRRAGVAASRRHMLPNPVADLGELPRRSAARDSLAATFGVPQDRRFLLYPVRCIRRKNVGEALLWSALAKRDTTVGLTLPPLNPQEQPSYQAWRRLATELELPCVFELGAPGGLPFHENLAAADRLLTTSVAEGFGMVFLESWLADRPLIGRDLPEITADFVAAGIQFDRLQPQLSVRVDWVGKDRFAEMFQAAYLQARADYGRRPPAADELRRQIEPLVDDDQVDFGMLSSRLQQEVIRSVCEDARRADDLRERNPWIDAALSSDDQDTEAHLKENAQVVRTSYSLEVSGQRLSSLYRTVVASPTDQPVEPPSGGQSILDAFLHPARLHPIRLET